MMKFDLRVRYACKIIVMNTSSHIRVVDVHNELYWKYS